MTKAVAQDMSSQDITTITRAKNGEGVAYTGGVFSFAPWLRIRGQERTKNRKTIKYTTKTLKRRNGANLDAKRICAYMRPFIFL